MSIAETVRKVQDAEAEAESILDAAHAQADEDLTRSRLKAAHLAEAAGEEAREHIERLRELSRAEEEAAIVGIENAARVEMAEIRTRADRNRSAATAALAELAGRLARDGS